jgi:predicted transcriptional regulator
MNTKELAEKLEMKVLSKFEPREISGVFVSDMLSDVMAGARSGNLWVTVQTHKSIVPAANLVDVSAIVITGGKNVPADTIELATKHGIAVLLTDLPAFGLIGKLYALGLATA